MMRLVNNYNQGSYARSEMFNIPRKIDSHHQPRERTPEPPGRPELPAQFSKLIVAQPVTLTVSKVTLTKPAERLPDGGYHVPTYEIEFDSGSDHGLFEGMEIPYKQGNCSGEIKLTTVKSQKSIGELLLYCDSVEEPEPPTVG